LLTSQGGALQFPDRFPPRSQCIGGRMRFPSVVFFFLVVFLSQMAVGQRPAVRSSRNVTMAPKADQSRYKGIFEPANYPDDLDLASDFFVSENEGWAAGNAGTIIHTTDGGKSWTAQLGGDLSSTVARMHDFRFLDRRRGWVIQDAANTPIFHTRDGQQWTQTGTLPNGGATDYAFTSETNGVYIPGFSKPTIMHTSDGGRTWKNAATCTAKFPVQGLMTNVNCELWSISFVNGSTGFAVGTGADALFLMKTQNGGATWSVSTVPNAAPGFQSNVHGFFQDENIGLVRVGDGKVLMTRDGGRSWQGTSGTNVAPSRIRYADPEVGWAFWSTNFSFTTDGGRDWAARNSMPFPAGVQDFSLPRRDVGYVVGQHGMVYRYHIVPADYRVANGVDAPAMPGYGAALNGSVQRIQGDIAQVQTKLNKSLTAAGQSPVTTDITSSAAASSDNSGGGAGKSFTASDSGSASSASGDTFSQSASSDTAAATASGDSGASSGANSAGAAADFTQPASSTIQSCCAAEVQQLQKDVSSFSQQAPAASSQYKNLNLIIAGLRMAQNLLAKTNEFKSSLQAFKSAPNLQSAATLLQGMVSQYDGMKQSFAGGFQNPPPLSDADAGASAAASFAGQSFSASDASSTDSSTTSNSGTQSGTQSGNQGNQPDQTKNSTVEKAKDKLKKLHIPF